MKPNHFLSKFLHDLNRGKSSPKIWASSVMFKETAQTKQWRKLGENSSNMVTLTMCHVFS
jgi:hypothetical protein